MRRMIRNLAVLFPHGVIRWLLRDEFSDTLAAGAVNGTPATPGPGTRVVVDTGNKVSISGGEYVFAGTSVTPWADPRIYYDAVVRVAGRLMVTRFIVPTAVGDGAILGFRSATAGGAANMQAGLYLTGTLWSWWGATGAQVGLFSADTYYVIVTVLRATGAYHFIRGGAFTDWTLLWISSIGNTATLYPAFDHSNKAMRADRRRIPVETWLPTPAAFDSFSRADGALGSSEIWGPDNQIVTARVWNNRVGTTLVATGVAQASALVGGIAIATVNTGTVNAITSATLTRAGNEVGVVLRYVDADNYIRAIHDGTNCKLVKRVAAAETDVISAVAALGAGAIRVIPDGTTFMLYLNNAQVGATSTINDAALQTGTEQGLYSTNLGNTQDLLSIFARGSNGEYAALNRWSF